MKTVVRCVIKTKSSMYVPDGAYVTKRIDRYVFLGRLNTKMIDVVRKDPKVAAVAHGVKLIPLQELQQGDEFDFGGNTT